MRNAITLLEWAIGSAFVLALAAYASFGVLELFEMIL